MATPAFDAKTSQQTFSLALSDVGEVVFLPAILKELRRLAPKANVRSVRLPAADVADALEAGAVDLAVGYFPDLKKHNFFQQAPPRIQLKQFWHRKFHHDERNSWLRALVCRLFQKAL